MQKIQLSLISRHVSDLGETLVVHEVNGDKYLVDPCDYDVVVQVPVGRRVNLVNYQFCSKCLTHGRDAKSYVTSNQAGLGFACERHLNATVILSTLRRGQLVDVMPAAEPAVAYAALLRPLPALRGAIAVNIYANDELVAA